MAPTPFAGASHSGWERRPNISLAKTVIHRIRKTEWDVGELITALEASKETGINNATLGCVAVRART